MSAIEFIAASDVSVNDIAATLKAAYADYYIPVDLDGQEMHTNLALDFISLADSLMVRYGGQWVGLGLLGQRAELGWIGGVGLLPAYRGQGIGRRLMVTLLNNAQSAGIEQVQLEVITQNARAMHLYESLGFRARRLLHLAEGQPKVTPDRAYRFRPMPAVEALQLHSSFGLPPNPWQRAVEGMMQMVNELNAEATILDGQVIAYAVGRFGWDGIRLVDAGFAAGHAPALRALVAELHQRHPYALGSIINIADDDPVWGVLAALGYAPFMQQIEMVKRLTTSNYSDE